MKLYYVSFFYFNFVLFFLFFLKIDLIFLIFLFFRKEYVMYKESLLEFNFQDFDGLEENSQVLDLNENKLYLDFGLDVGLEEQYLYEIYMDYALYDFSMEFESFTGRNTLKWSDFDLEELSFNQKLGINLKKVYLKDTSSIDSFYWKNLNQKEIDTSIKDDDYSYIYNYKNIIRREIEDATFGEENEKYYYPYLKKYFLKENFYDVFMEDYYFRNLNYSNFVNKLKEREKSEKLYIKKNMIISKNDIKIGLDMLEFNNNINEIKNDFLLKSFFNKEEDDEKKEQNEQ